MRIVTKAQMEQLMLEHPDGGIVFADYHPDVIDDIQVTDGNFGATTVVPYHGEVFDYDWNIREYRDSDLFAVFDHSDILQMIQTLTKGLTIELKDEGRELYGGV